MYLVVAWDGLGVPANANVWTDLNLALQNFKDIQNSGDYQIRAITFYKINLEKVETVFRMERAEDSDIWKENRYY